jgi:hypothetical protein
MILMMFGSDLFWSKFFDRANLSNFVSRRSGIGEAVDSSAVIYCLCNDRTPPKKILDS